MKHKSGLVGFSYLGGLVCAAFFNHSLVFAPAAVFLAAALILMLFGKRSAAVIFFTAFLSVCAYEIYTAAVYLPIAALGGKTADISGEITDINRFSGDTASYVIKTNIDGINTYINVFASDNGGKIGDNISFTGKISLMTDSTVFAAESFYKSKGVFLTAAPKSDIVINSSGAVSIKGLIFGYSDYIGERISEMLSGDEGGLIKAMFLGDKSGLSDYLSYNIKRAGVSHFTAVSGMHLTIISHMILIAVSLTPLGNRRYFRFGVLLLLILIFTVFFKMSVSVIRSGIMLILYYGSEIVMRKGSPINSMGFAAFIITLFNPYACTDPALLLSLAGTFGVGVVSPVICRFLKRDRLYLLKSGIAASVCAVLCTFPLTCIFFGGFSTVGILTNLLIYPLALCVILCAALFAAVGGAGGGLMLIAGLCAKGMISIINFLGELKYSYFKISCGFIAPIAFAAVLFAVIVYMRFYSVKKTLTAVVLSISIVLSMSAGCMLNNSGKIFISMYSDGNDACVMIKRGGSMISVLTEDSQRLTEKVRQCAKESFVDTLSAVCLLNSGNNNIDAFKAVSCAEFIPPNTEKEILGDNITITAADGECKISINGFSVTVSPACEPKDDEIAILYGYKRDIPKLSGLTFCSCKRNIPENDEYYNFYYNNAEYIIDKGYLQPI